ncbi:hypothetical protein Mspyr1_01520 [Mycolicibacterium gilvum Spyr1]|uniref:Uncharacterized protein n=1 Tax=Mycolicibacterium gilvum (strain DSM 45189 / LMG 24558 / Spyr1) TaxID=278137 RepID=E6TIR2_MYCSR|nr:hypothetical protein Mspyr1_01520 [Mycolicibacterium gilvum Spyr1]
MPPARGHRSDGLLREPVHDDGSASQDCDREQHQDRKSHPSQRVAEHPDSVHHKRFRRRGHGEHVTSHKRHGRSARDHTGDDLEMPEPIGATIGIACRPGRSGEWSRLTPATGLFVGFAADNSGNDRRACSCSRAPRPNVHNRAPTARRHRHRPRPLRGWRPRRKGKSVKEINTSSRDLACTAAACRTPRKCLIRQDLASSRLHKVTRRVRQINGVSGIFG